MRAAPIRRFVAPRLAVLILATLSATTTPVAAHPLGNFTVNRYSRVEVGGDAMRVRYVLDLAEIPSVQETQVADLNHDGVVSAAEWDAYRVRRVEEIRANLALAVDSTPVLLQTDESTLTTPVGQATIPLIRIEAWFRADWARPAESTSPHAVTFQDRNEPARLGWREIVVRAGPGVSLSQSTAPATDTTDELRTYPDQFLHDPLDVRQATWTMTVIGSTIPSTAPAIRSAGTAGRPVDPFTSLVTAADLNLGVVLVALAAAATLGGIHAASPGHGKTVMAAYIVGTRGTFFHAIVLGLSVTVSHTVGVLVLGGITLLASNLILPEQLYPWLTLIAAMIVLVLGASLLFNAVRGLQQPVHQHTHEHDHHHDHDHPHPHPHGPEDAHVPSEPRRSLPITWRSLFMLGLAGGIVPSASALVVLLSALALGRLGFGLLLIVAFGFGMAVVLTTTGVLLVTASRFMARYFPDDTQSPLQRMFARAVPLASAGIMLVIGLVATLQALGQFGILQLF